MMSLFLTISMKTYSSQELKLKKMKKGEKSGHFQMSKKSGCPGQIETYGNPYQETVVHFMN